MHTTLPDPYDCICIANVKLFGAPIELLLLLCNFALSLQPGQAKQMTPFGFLPHIVLCALPGNVGPPGY